VTLFPSTLTFFFNINEEKSTHFVCHLDRVLRGNKGRGEKRSSARERRKQGSGKKNLTRQWDERPTYCDRSFKIFELAGNETDRTP
jgi:hypothetical protein